VNNWITFVMTPDGSSYAATAGGAYSGYPYPSLQSWSNFGLKWTVAWFGLLDSSNHATAPANMNSLCISSNGTIVAEAEDGGIIRVSNNSGVDMYLSDAPTNNWVGLVCSQDGSNMVAVASTGVVMVSTNSGIHWILRTNTPPLNFQCLAGSWDAQKLVAGTSRNVFNVPVYVSSDFGVTWTAANTPDEFFWYKVASSADGNHLAASGSDGYIYTWTFNGPPPVPQLTHFLAGNNSVLTWPASGGGNFVLQQSSSLSAPNWANVFWPIITNGTNYQVTVPISAGNSFFRLKAQ